MRIRIEALPGELASRQDDLHRLVDKLVEGDGGELHKAHRESPDMPFAEPAMEGVILSAAPVVERIRKLMLTRFTEVLRADTRTD